MKKIYSLLLFIFIAVSISGEPITAEKAKTIASSFFNKHIGRRALSHSEAEKELHYVETDLFPACHIFNVGRQNGFVIVSSDDQVEEILGYSETGYIDLDNMPEQLQSMLKEYAKYQQWAVDNNIQRRASTTYPTGKIAPRLRAAWGQRAPYNALCPTVTNDEGKSDLAPTGCVVTAMAQMMYYDKCPVTPTKTIPAYVTSTEKISRNALEPIAFDWESMVDDYKTGNPSQAAKTAVATLMQYAGTAVKVNYTYGGSGSSIERAMEALVEYFNYDNTAQCIYRKDYKDDEWVTRVYNALKERPLLFRGLSPTAGHCFICDGYDGNGKFYFNWGWDGAKGNADGYFSLFEMNPKGGVGYVSNETFVDYLKPMETAYTKPENAAILDLRVKNDQLTYTRSSTSVAFPSITLVSKIANYNKQAHNFEVGFALYKDEEFVQYISNTATTASLGSWTAQHNVNVTFSLKLANGTYQIKPVSRVSGTSQWYLSKGYNTYYIEAIVSGKTLTINSIAYDNPKLEAFFYPISTPKAGHNTEFFLRLTNNGGDYEGKVYLAEVRDGLSGKTYSKLSSLYVEVHAGSQGGYYPICSLEETGTYQLAILDKWGKSFGEISVDVVAETVPVNNLETVSDYITTGILQEHRQIGTRLKGGLNIRNNDNQVFDDGIYISLWNVTKQQFEGEDIYYDVTLNPNQVKTYTFDFDNLYTGDKYLVYGYYSDFNDYFSILSYYLVVESDDGSVGDDGVMTKIQNIKTNQDIRQTIYSIDGRRVPSVEKAHLGVYIRNGKKYVKP